MTTTKSFFVLAATSIVFTLGAIHAAQNQAKPSLPYVAAHDPQFLPASSATFLHDPDRVIGLMAGNVAKAYPAAILSQHGLVEDQSPSGPIAVTWWSYCNTALVFRAASKGRELHMDNAGVVGGNEVFQDRETGSRWQQSSLQAISGPLKGERLELYPFLLTDWKEWHRLHPDTLVLKPLPGYADRIPEKNEMIRRGLSGTGSAPPGVLRVDDRLKPKTMILGLDVGGSSEVFPLTVLREARVIRDDLGGQPVLIVHQPTSDTTTAFIARARGRSLRFRASNADATELTDKETGSRWDAYGKCVSGPLKGSQLESLILEPEYWFAWSEFHPETKIYSTTAAKP